MKGIVKLMEIIGEIAEDSNSRENHKLGARAAYDKIEAAMTSLDKHDAAELITVLTRLNGEIRETKYPMPASLSMQLVQLLDWFRVITKRSGALDVYEKAVKLDRKTEN